MESSASFLLPAFAEEPVFIALSLKGLARVAPSGTRAERNGLQPSPRGFDAETPRARPGDAATGPV